MLTSPQKDIPSALWAVLPLRQRRNVRLDFPGESVKGDMLECIKNLILIGLATGWIGGKPNQVLVLKLVLRVLKFKIEKIYWDENSSVKV